MSTKYLTMTDSLYDYLLSVAVQESDLQRHLREETAAMPLSSMQISPDQGQFMDWLVRLMGARRALEVGVFTGYSALCVAKALPEDGRLVACDVSAEWTRIARRYWVEAGVAHKIELRLGPALTTLDSLLADGQAGSFDFAFIDADKENYLGYYERTLQLLRTGGVVAIDNVLWSGKVADSDDHETETEAIRALNTRLAADPRVAVCMLPVADGLTLALKRVEDGAAGQIGRPPG